MYPDLCPLFAGSAPSIAQTPILQPRVSEWQNTVLARSIRRTNGMRSDRSGEWRQPVFKTDHQPDCRCVNCHFAFFVALDFGPVFLFAFAHLAFAAALAFAFRASGVNDEKPFGTFFAPPKRPSATAAAFFLAIGLKFTCYNRFLQISACVLLPLIA